MSIFEQLRPFVSLCQACGMIPYTIEDNLITNKFSRFTFSFNHLTTWWFFLILLVIHPVVLIVMWYMIKDVPIHLLMGRDMPITVTVLLTVTAISYFVELFLSRWIVSRHRKLQHAIKAIQEVEKIFGEKFLSQHKSSIGYQIIIGFILVIIVVSSKHEYYTNMYLRDDNCNSCEFCSQNKLISELIGYWLFERDYTSK